MGKKDKQPDNTYEDTIKKIRHFDGHIADLQIKRDGILQDCMKQFKRTEQQVLWDLNHGGCNGKET